jgi:hypothetical protein
MRREAVAVPAEREFPAGELVRRRHHLVSEARRVGRTSRPARPLAIAAVIAFACVLSIPALGVIRSVESWISTWRDPHPPVPVGPDFVVASGVAGSPWKIVATRTDQGLCLFLLTGAATGFGGCGARDIPPHAIGALGFGTKEPGLDRIFEFGPLAPEVSSVELRLRDGRTLHARVVESSKEPGAPEKFYWASWNGSQIAVAIARDADGHAIERRVPSWNGNPTGDPDGLPPP